MKKIGTPLSALLGTTALACANAENLGPSALPLPAPTLFPADTGATAGGQSVHPEQRGKDGLSINGVTCDTKSADNLDGAGGHGQDKLV